MFPHLESQRVNLGARCHMAPTPLFQMVRK